MNRQATKAQKGPIPEELDRLARLAVDAAFTVHFTLGPALLESVYELSGPRSL